MVIRHTDTLLCLVPRQFIEQQFIEQQFIERQFIETTIHRTTIHRTTVHRTTVYRNDNSSNDNSPNDNSSTVKFTERQFIEWWGGGWREVILSRQWRVISKRKTQLVGNEEVSSKASSSFDLFWKSCSESTRQSEDDSFFYIKNGIVKVLKAEKTL